jgi:hypothetical protein
MNPMLNLWEDHVFVELNYPHIIGSPGYEQHHDVATLFRENTVELGKVPAPIVPSTRNQTLVKPWRSKGRNRVEVLKA